MTMFHVGDPDDAQDVQASLDAMVTGGGFAAATPTPGVNFPSEARAVLPAGVLHTEVLVVCRCGLDGCNGWAGVSATQMLVGWESAAALAGQMSVFLDNLPTHLKDQAARLYTDSAAAVRAANERLGQ